MIKGFKTINVWEYSRKEFDILVKKYGMVNAHLFDCMVKYFKDQDISPMDRLEDKSEDLDKKFLKLEKLICRNHDRVIGFMKSQEADIFFPVIRNSNVLVERIGELFESHGIKQEKGLVGNKEKEVDYRKEESGGENLEIEEVRKKHEEELEELKREYEEKVEYLKEKLGEFLEGMKTKGGLFSSKIELEGFTMNYINEVKKSLEEL